MMIAAVSPSSAHRAGTRIAPARVAPRLGTMSSSPAITASPHPGHHRLDRDRVLAGLVAARKGHSFFWYFIFSLVFFPLALLVAYMVDDRGVATA